MALSFQIKDRFLLQMIQNNTEKFYLSAHINSDEISNRKTFQVEIAQIDT